MFGNLFGVSVAGEATDLAQSLERERGQFGVKKIFKQNIKKSKYLPYIF